MKKTITALLLACCAWFACAQDRADSMHVAHYDLHLDIMDFSTKTINGYVDLTMVSKVNNLHAYVLDLQGLTVDSVLVDGQPATFTHQDLKVNIPHTSQQGDTAIVRVYYHGAPIRDSQIGGFYYVGQYCYNIGVAFAYQPHSFGRCWIPCLDFFTDKSTYTMHIRTEAGKMAVCGGMLTDSVTLADSTRIWTWVLEQPIPVYLASVAVGDYRLYEDLYHGIEADIPIHIYAQPSTIDRVEGSFLHLKEVLQMYEQNFGPYRWPRVGYVDVNYNSGAMEHATNIAYPHSAFTGTTAYESLYAHELFHLWFGDLITCNRAEEMWINEGFASYAEALCEDLLNSANNPNAYADYIRNLHHSVLKNLKKEDGGYYALDNVPQTHTYGTHSYSKGSLVIHSLRNYMGDSLFFSGLRSLLNQYAYQNVSSEQLFNHLTQTSGMNMHDFYEGWVHQPGFLHFSIDSIVPLQGDLYRVYLHQKLMEATQFANSNKVDLTFVSSQRELYTIPNAMFSGEFGHVDVTIPFVPVFGMVDYYEKIIDAMFDYTKSMVSGETWEPTDAASKIMLESFPDTVLVRLEHNYVAPDQPETLPDGIYRISQNHYWNFNIAYNTQINTIPTGTISFRFQKGNSNMIDNTLMQGYNETNIKLLYRSTTAQPWQVVHTTRTGTAYSGYLTTDFNQPGQYCLAVGDPSVEIQEYELGNGLHIYPNPVKDMLNILIMEPEKNVKASILDSTGKTVKNIRLKSGENHYNVSNLIPGIYVIHIPDGNRLWVSRFVKE